MTRRVSTPSPLRKKIHPADVCNVESCDLILVILLVVVVTITKLEQLLVVDDLNKWPSRSHPSSHARRREGVDSFLLFREIRTALTGVQILRGSYGVVLQHSDKGNPVLLLGAFLLPGAPRTQVTREVNKN